MDYLICCLSSLIVYIIYLFNRICKKEIVGGKSILKKIDWSNWHIERPIVIPEYDGPLIKNFDHLLRYYNIDIKNFNVIEIGAGHGGFTIPHLSKRVKSILAVEPNKVLYEELNKNIKKYNRTNIQTLQSTCENLKIKEWPIENGALFDMAIFYGSFDWVSGKDKCLSIISNLLKPKSYMVISEPLKFYRVNEDIPQEFVSDEKEQHRAIINTIESIVKSKDFKIVRVTPAPLDIMFWLLQKN